MFANLKTRSKLILGFGIVIIFLAVIAVTAFVSLRAERDADKSIQDVLELRVDINGQRASLLVAMLLPSGPAQDAKLEEVKEYTAQNHEAISRLEADYAADRLLSGKIAEMKAVLAEFEHARDEQVVPAIHSQKVEEAKPLILGVQTERYVKIRTISREITKALGERSDVRFARMEWILGFLGGGALLTALAMVTAMGRTISVPLQEMSLVADKIADGDLNVQFASGVRRDEIGKLAQTFQRMVASLSVLAGRAKQIADGDLTVQIAPQSERDVLGNAFAGMAVTLRRLMQELLDAVNVLASAASEIMASTSQLASTAAETAAAVTETTATVEEVKQTSQLSSQKAKSVAEESEKAAQIATDGKRAVQETVEGMNGIRSQMGAVAESILTLSAQSRAIGEIISSVDDLAAQSKLLAVNAAIEAAKAGDEGKGFSVVAAEVKSLAEQSKQATTQVRGILGEIQKATSNAVMATEQGSKAVEAGVRQSNAAGESIGTLADNVADSAEAASQIAATSEQQFVGMDQIAMAMENIKTASTQTAASTRQAETAAQQLHDIGQKLKRLVERFKV